MLGAIIGDVVGSRFEFKEDDNRRKNFAFFTADCRATDDTFMTIAVAKALFLSKGDEDKLKNIIVDCMKEVASAHPHTGWGERFYKWLFVDKPSRPYNSFGNGSAMRVSPVGWVAESEEEVIRLSRIVTEVTHNHPEGIKGAEAVAMGVYLARNGYEKDYIRSRLSEYYSELNDPDFTIDNIYGRYGYDDDGMWVTCQGSVPQALVAFLDGTDFEDVVRNAVYIGGDSDTIGAMAGSIAEAYYGVPLNIEMQATDYLTDDLKSIYYAFETIKKPRLQRKS